MAVIKAVSSKAGIGHAIDYVTKKEKTEEKLVSGLHCEPETVKEEMQATKELWGKTDGRTYKHYVQSYHEDEEITPEQAHKNAVELAEHTKAWKGHEVLIATHIDKGHIHTHFIVNSVNYENKVWQSLRRYLQRRASGDFSGLPYGWNAVKAGKEIPGKGF